MVENVLASIANVLEGAAVDRSRISEVQALIDRAPYEVGVAVLGPHNAGKTSLIAALTDSPIAKEDIGPDVRTTVSAPYPYSAHDTTFVLWDTPGLGTEHLDHDANARDRVSQADAVVVALSEDGVSQRGRDQLDELLTVGRKRGAVLLVVTKADREAEENRPAIAAQLTAAFPQATAAPLFIAARDVLEAREDGVPVPEASGFTELSKALEALALGEARTRMRATAAIRLLVLIDEAEGALGSLEPEQEATLVLQRRLQKLLKRTDRRLTEAAQQATRKARMAGLQAAAAIATGLDKKIDASALEVIAEDSWQTFVETTTRLDEDLVATLATELSNADDELTRLDQGALASALRHAIDELDEQSFNSPQSARVGDTKFEAALLDAVKRAGKLLKAAKASVKVKGKKVPAALVADVAAEALGFYVAHKEEAAITEAKESVRAGYSAQVELLRERWEDYVTEIRDETTRRLLVETTRVEDELFSQLTSTQEQQRALRDARTELDREIDAAISSGYVDAEVA